MRRLYLKIYAALVLAVVLSIVTGVVTDRMLRPTPPMELTEAFFEQVGVLRRTPASELRQAMDTAVEQVPHLSVGLFERGQFVYTAGAGPVPPPRRGPGVDHPVRGPNLRGRALRLDRGWLVVVSNHRPPPPSELSLGLSLLAVALVLALAALPIARGLSRRLETLQDVVEEFGQGNLDARAELSGADEVAELARSFNHSAGRIQQLMRAQQRVVAHASHELRSPLARLQMALSLVDQDDPAQRLPYLDEARQNIHELDGLIEDILLSSRLDAGVMDPPSATLDLLPIVTEEANRVGATVQGQATVIADGPMIRRLVRNLLENAQTYGASPITVHLHPQSLVVRDAGPPIPADEAEQLFEPFYRRPGHAESAGGVGLGLALVRQIALYHGATVHCTDRDGGTAFVVQWPTSP